jgi:hypothetical protein
MSIDGIVGQPCGLYCEASEYWSSRKTVIDRTSGSVYINFWRLNILLYFASFYYSTLSHRVSIADCAVITLHAVELKFELDQTKVSALRPQLG